MVMIDDATNRTYARFSEQETTRAAYDTFEGYVRRHKMPVGLYVDRDSIYRTDREPTVAEQLAGQEPLTQFGRAMKGLGVSIELAYSPQAKGRVERRNGLLREGQKLKCRELARRPLAVAQPKPARSGTPPAKPKESHPWRHFGTGVGKEFWRGVKARARSARQLSPGPRSASASLRPHSGPGRVAKKSPVVNNGTKGDIFS